MKKFAVILLLFFIALIPIFLGIFHPGFLLTDDGNWMVIRLSAFYEALRQGQFPVRYLPRLNNGFGYPVSDFLYPLFLYAGAFLHALHIDFTLSIKLLFGISMLASALGVFFWLRKRFGDTAGFVGGVVYALFPYHVWDVTKRGSLGEVMAMGVIPFIFWQIDRGSRFWTAICIGILITAHNSLALLFFPIIIVYIAIEKKLKQLSSALILGLGIATFFWLPALFDKQFTVFDMTAVSQLSQYFLSFELYPLIGILSFVIIFLSLIAIYKKPANLPIYFLVVTLFSLSFTNKVSFLIWQAVHLEKYVQFPFRFLSITTLGVAFLSSFLVMEWKKKKNSSIPGIILILLYASSFQFFFAPSYQYYQDEFYATNQDSTTVKNEYMPLGVKKIPTTKTSLLSLSSGSVSGIENRGKLISFTTYSPKPTGVVVAKVYFPGWEAKIDNKITKIDTQDITGFITLLIPKGSHNIQIYFGETPMRLFADGISLLSLCVLAGIGIVQRRKQYV